MRDVFIINPTAGKKNAAVRFIEKVKAYFAQNGGEYKILLTQREGHGETLTRAEAETGDAVRIWAVGGDGTLLEVARGAEGFSNAAVGVFPYGSGNDFVRMFGAREVFMNFEKQLAGAVHTIDMIRTENGSGLNICSIGFDAKVASLMYLYKRIPGVTGEMAYTMSLARCLLGKLADPMHVVITTEDGTEETYDGEFVFALAGNGRWYGGGFCGAPKAVLNDGLLDFVLIRKPSYPRLPRLVQCYKQGRHIDDKKLADLVVYRRGVRIRMESDVEMCTNMDGNTARSKCETYTVAPGALRLILPLGVALP